MQIPSTFTLGGMTWKVKLVKHLPGKYGDCSLKNTTIRIVKSLDQSIKEQTFCHELTHAIQYAMAKDNHDEEFTDLFATFLHQYLSTVTYE